MKKAIIFDMDGLMIDSERVTYEEYCHKLDQLGYKFDETLYRRCLGKNKKGVYQVLIDHYGEDFPIDEVWDDVHVSLDNRLKLNTPLKKGIVELLTFLKENNYKSFPNRIKNISGIDLKNTSIEIAYNEKFSTKKFIHYKISVKSKIDNHEKYNFVKMKIQNPYFGISEEDVETENINSNETVKSEEEISPEKNNENVNINESDLITFYNYEEE